MAAGVSVAILAAAVFVFMLPYFVYLQTVDGIIAHLQRGAAFAALEVPRQRLTIAGQPLYDAWLLAAVWMAPIVALAVLLVPVIRRREGAWTIARHVLPIVALAIVTNAAAARIATDTPAAMSGVEVLGRSERTGDSATATTDARPM